MKGSHLQTYEFGDFRLDLDERMLLPRDGRPIALTPRVFETLRHLVENAGRVSDKQALMEAVWPDCIVEENNLAQNISTLRRILGDKPGSQHYIATVPGRGYRFLPEVKASGNGKPVVAGGVDPGRPQLASQFTQPASTPPATTWARWAGVVLAVFLLGAATFLWWRSSHRVMPPVPDKSIAVLPFLNLSPDPDNAYFADGIKDEILTRLSKIGSLKVISRTSTQEFAGKTQNAREIAQRLGVANIVEGSVQKSGDAVRVTVQLIHAPSDTHLWAETYDRSLTNMFQVETEIAQRIAAALEMTLTRSEKHALAAQPTEKIEAHEAYLRGRYFWNKRTLEGFKEATMHLQRAIELDPLYAEAYVGLGDALQFLGGDNFAHEKAAQERSRGLLRKALELNDTLGEAHASLGLFAMNIDWDWANAEKEFKRAIELNPNYATAHQWYGEFLVYMGRFEEAIAESTRARELDPLSLIINTDLGKVYGMARRYDEAVPHFKAALKLDPDFAEAHGLLALVYAFQQRYETAMSEIEKIKNLKASPGYLCWKGYIYGISGRKDEARNVIAQLNELSRQTYVSPFWLATVWTALGENDEAFRWFDQVFAERAGGGAVTLKVNPGFDPLRSDPRYADLLRRAHFSPEQQ
jgi:TolB-like protein/DNA-binding winged helix-turn-helix (wHTH) protein